MQIFEITDLVHRQQQYFESGATRPLQFRLTQLRRLRQAIHVHENDILTALAADMKKPMMEAYCSEIHPIYHEIDHTLHQLKKWMRPRRERTPWLHFPSTTHLYADPYGLAVIISPWNYPIHLLLSPLVGAIAGGNCAILKPSEIAVNCEGILSSLINETFDPSYIGVITGGPDTAGELINQPIDKIFFTGSPSVGKIVMKAAAERLIPATLELGGKSPCIVDETVPLRTAARRIVWGKFFNAGQTCIAPDYVLVHSHVKGRLIDNMRTALSEFYGGEPKDSPNYCRIINDMHFRRLVNLIDPMRVVHGGEYDETDRYIAPTIIDPVTLDDPLMNEEIFGPILPVIEYDTFDEVLKILRYNPNPLTAYIFSEDKVFQKQLIENVTFGCGCINDTLSHNLNSNLPFGGRGNSGMGAYHGKASFDAFTHTKGIQTRANWFDLTLRYPPYRMSLRQIKTLLRLG